MTKREKIKYLVAEYAKTLGINSEGWKRIYTHQDYIVNAIDRAVRASYVDEHYRCVALMGETPRNAFRRLAMFAPSLRAYLRDD